MSYLFFELWVPLIVLFGAALYGLIALVRARLARRSTPVPLTLHAAALVLVPTALANAFLSTGFYSCSRLSGLIPSLLLVAAAFALLARTRIAATLLVIATVATIGFQGVRRRDYPRRAEAARVWLAEDNKRYRDCCRTETFPCEQFPMLCRDIGAEMYQQEVIDDATWLEKSPLWIIGGSAAGLFFGALGLVLGQKRRAARA